MSDTLPSDTVTFLFTDIERSTETVQALSGGVDGPDDALEPYLRALLALVAEHGGRIGGTPPAGDTLLAAFPSATDALECAARIQQLPIPGPTFAEGAGRARTGAVRIAAVHAAQRRPTPGGDGMFLQQEDVTHGSRILRLAHEGQILVSDEARRRSDEGRWAGRWAEWPNRRIKDWETPETLHELRHDGREAREPGAQFLPEWFREQDAYVPRPALEAEILDGFRRKTRAGGGGARLVTIHGHGGTGRTRLAMHCCIQAVGMFEGRLYCARPDASAAGARGDDRSRLGLLAAAIAEALPLTGGEPVTPETLPQRLPKNVRLLLLVNDYETVASKASALLLQRLLDARPGLVVLVTGRGPVGLAASEVDRHIVGLEPADARRLFLARVRERKGDPGWSPPAPDERAVGDILELTARIPLALELVAARTDRTASGSAAGLETESLPKGAAVPPPPADAARRVGAGGRHQALENCLNWSWNLLTGPGQREALVCLGLFADGCPAEEMAACFPEIAGEPLEAVLDAGLARRRKDGETGTGLYTLLRPVRAFARERLPQTDPENALRARFVAHFRQVARENGGFQGLEVPAERVRLQAVWRHALAAGHVAAALGDAGACADIANGLMHFVMHRALWEYALPCFERAAEVCGRALPEHDPSLASVLNNLAVLYQAQGRYGEAEPLFVRALEIRENGLPENGLDVAVALNNLAVLYTDQSRYTEAEPLYERALALRERALPEDDPDVATTLNGLAELYQAWGRPVKAEPLYQRSLEILDRILPGNHPALATALNNLAVLYADQSRYGAAEPLYERALGILERVLPEDDPSLATVLNNLAGSYLARGRPARAEPLYERSLGILQRILPEDAPDLAVTLNNLAVAYADRGRYAEAMPLFERALRIERRTTGARRLVRSRVLNNYLLVVVQQGPVDTSRVLLGRLNTALRRRGFVRRR